MIMINILPLKNLVTYLLNFSARLAQANIASKNEIANFVKEQILTIN